jgi:hypothetical protein
VMSGTIFVPIADRTSTIALGRRDFSNIISVVVASNPTPIDDDSSISSGSGS